MKCDSCWTSRVVEDRRAWTAHDHIPGFVSEPDSGAGAGAKWVIYSCEMPAVRRFGARVAPRR